MDRSLKMSGYCDPIAKNAVEYFRQCLENYGYSCVSIDVFRKHIGQASFEIRNYINQNYPGRQFRSFLKSHRDCFYVWYNTVSINRLAPGFSNQHDKKAIDDSESSDSSSSSSSNDWRTIIRKCRQPANIERCRLPDDRSKPANIERCRLPDTLRQPANIEPWLLSYLRHQNNGRADEGNWRERNCRNGGGGDDDSCSKHQSVSSHSGREQEHNNGTAVKSIQDVSEIDDVVIDLQNLLTSQTNSDVTLQVDTEMLPAHKLILGARSSVFAAMFVHPFQEGNSNVVTISDVSSTVMKDLLQFIYTGKIKDLSTEKALGLYKAADKYDLKKLKEKCSEILTDTFTVDNICEIAVIADMHNDCKLFDAVKKFIHKNINVVLSTRSWSDLIVTNCRLGSDILLAVTSQITAK